jgi:hypothetical protein
MTTQQQNIIDSLVAEFNKINKPVHNGFARIGEVLDKCDEWATLYAGVTASNERFEYLREQMIETDYNRLVEECRLAGINLRIEEHSDYILIDNCHGYNYYTDNAIRIYYEFETIYRSSDTGKSIYEAKSIRLHSYKASSNVVTFATIEELFMNGTFFKNWTKLIEISRK